ncbi:hypothetical protein ACIOML_01900 [Streptomyces anulatus]
MATQYIRGGEVCRIPGLFQTADYARHAFEANAEFRRRPVAAGVRGCSAQPVRACGRVAATP